MHIVILCDELLASFIAMNDRRRGLDDLVDLDGRGGSAGLGLGEEEGAFAVEGR